MKRVYRAPSSFLGWQRGRAPRSGVCVAPGNRKPDCRSLNKEVYLFLKKKLVGRWSEAGWGAVVPSGVLFLPGMLASVLFLVYFKINFFKVFFGVSLYIHRVVPYSPLCNIRAFSSPQEEIQTHGVPPAPRLFPQQPLKYFLSLQTCLCWIFHINGIITWSLCLASFT